jgi:hypothetical protein
MSERRYRNYRAERRGLTVDPEVKALKCREKTERINLGLALLSVARKPGAALTFDDIAAWCGCTEMAIVAIEQKALRKLRFALVQAGGPEALAAWQEMLAEERRVPGVSPRRGGQY